MSYTISEVANRTGMSVHTIRYYHAQGLLPYVIQSKNGHRVFSEDDVLLLIEIKKRLSAGMTIKDMQHLVHDVFLNDDAQAGLPVLLRRREELIASIEKQRKALQFMDELIARYKSYIKDSSHKHEG